MARLILLLLGITLSATISWAQTQNPATPHQHTAAPAVIDGAAHPDLVPDSIAYRLYFVALSIGPNPTEDDRKRQQAQLNMVGLGHGDQEILVSIVTELRTKRDALVSQYNQAAQAAADRADSSPAAPLGSEFRRKRGVQDESVQILDGHIGSRPLVVG